jgi:hypothetical protein
LAPVALATPSTRPEAGLLTPLPGNVSCARKPGVSANESREIPSVMPLTVTHFINSRREGRIVLFLFTNLRDRATERETNKHCGAPRMIQPGVLV